MNKYEIKLTVETEAKHEAHAANRVKKALREYGCDPNELSIVTLDVEEIKPPGITVGMGSFFRKNEDLYVMVSSGRMANTYILARLKDGCWSICGTVEEIVEKMGCSLSGEWTLVKAQSAAQSVDWTGEVKLEEVAL